MQTSPRLVVGWFLRTRWPTDRWSLSAGGLQPPWDEVFQWYIISDPSFAMEHSDELIFYDEELDLYLLAVTHFGTAWDCVPAPELH